MHSLSESSASALVQVHTYLEEMLKVEIEEERMAMRARFAFDNRAQTLPLDRALDQPYGVFYCNCDHRTQSSTSEMTLTRWFKAVFTKSISKVERWSEERSPSAILLTPKVPYRLAESSYRQRLGDLCNFGISPNSLRSLLAP